MPDSAFGPEERARASGAARRALINLALDRGAEYITPEAYRGSDRTVRDLEPLAGARAARDIELGARHAARDYIRQAREAGTAGIRSATPSAWPPTPTPTRPG